MLDSCLRGRCCGDRRLGLLGGRCGRCLQRQLGPLDFGCDGIAQALQVGLHQLTCCSSGTLSLGNRSRQLVQDVPDSTLVTSHSVECGDRVGCCPSGSHAAFHVDDVASTLQVLGVAGFGGSRQRTHLFAQQAECSGADLDQLHHVGLLVPLLHAGEGGTAGLVDAGVCVLRLLHRLSDLVGTPVALDRLLGYLAGDRLVGNDAAQRNALADRQLTGHRLIEKPLRQAGQGQAFSCFLPADTDPLLTQVVGPHARVAEDLGRINRCALVISDVLQGANGAGLLRRRHVQHLDIDDRRPGSLGQLQPVVAIHHIDAASRAQLSVHITPCADDTSQLVGELLLVNQ